MGRRAVAFTEDSAPLAYIYRWDRQGRKGHPCAVVVRAKVMNSCLVRFADGYQMVTSRNALIKNRATG